MVEYGRQLLSYYVLEEMRHSPLHLQLNYPINICPDTGNEYLHEMINIP